MTGRRPRRRAVEVREAVLEAALAELEECGYFGVTFEGVARRAGASKSVLYRRYDDRASLIFDAMRTAVTEVVAPEATGDLRQDLLAWLGAALDRAAQVGPLTYRGLVGEAQPETLKLIGGVVSGASLLLRQNVIIPAQKRGQLGPIPLELDVITVPMRLLRDHLVFGWGDRGGVLDIVDMVALPLYRSASGLRAAGSIEPPNAGPTGSA